jgi:hypothetical protein
MPELFKKPTMPQINPADMFRGIGTFLTKASDAVDTGMGHLNPMYQTGDLKAGTITGQIDEAISSLTGSKKAGAVAGGLAGFALPTPGGKAKGINTSVKAIRNFAVQPRAYLHILSPNGATVQLVHAKDLEKFKAFIDTGNTNRAQELLDKTGKSFHLSSTPISQMTSQNAKLVDGLADYKAVENLIPKKGKSVRVRDGSTGQIIDNLPQP